MLNLRDTLKEEKRKKDEMGFAGVAWPEEKNWIHLFLFNDVQKHINIYEVMYKS